ncbi:MAG: protein kinase [Thermoanaerobaculia bacterium]|nr:protein kinase [Thermoanaerobaculia bacterium]
MEVAQFLRSVDVFASLSAAAATELAAKVEIVDYPAGTRILARDEPGDRMFVIVEGEVRIPILDENGKQRFLAHLESTQIFGEMALLTGRPRTADVIAVTPCRCLSLRKATVEALMSDLPEIARFLTAILGERLISIGGIQQVGKYRLAGELGRGKMSLVFEAVHPTLNRPVAIKMLSHELVYQPHFAERFRHEARTIAQLRHPNIVEVYDTEEAYATFFIVMERVAGIVLDEAIRRAGRLPPETARDILRQLTSALGAAHHRGIVHRDVKPSNVAFAYEGQVKLMDFGLAFSPEIALTEKLQEDVAGVGTPCYMAPEQIRGTRIDGRCDIYSLGILAYEMLTGDPPFVGNMFHVLHQHLHGSVPSLREAVPDAPGDLVEFVARATARDAADRFADCEEAARCLDPAGGATSLASLGVQTLTLVYDPESREKAEALLDDCRRQAREIPGVLER